MFKNCQVLQLENQEKFKIGESVLVMGRTLIIFGYTRGGYLAWTEKGGEVFRII